MSDQVTAPVSDLFPDIIIFEILTHLPAKEVCRFKTVSKRSLSLISHPYFLSTYLSRNPSTWVLLDRIITLNNNSPIPIHLQPSKLHTLSINPSLLLKPDETLVDPALNSYPARIYRLNNGLILFGLYAKPNPGNVSANKRARAPLVSWTEEICNRHFTFVGLDLREVVLFITNPVTRQWARLPSCPYRIKLDYRYALLTRADTGEFVVAVYIPNLVEEEATMTCFSSQTGKWVRKKASYPLGRREFEQQMVFEFEGKLHLADVSVGIVRWEVEDYLVGATLEEEEAVCVLIPLPSGREREEWTEDLGERRSVDPFEGKWLQYMEMMEEAELGLYVWRMEVNSEWNLVYRVPMVDIERGLRGFGFELAGVTNAFFADPVDADFVVLSNEDLICYLDLRTGVVSRPNTFQHQYAVPFLLPSWPTPLPPRSYAYYEKEQGNGYFKVQDFIKAVQCYSKSIAVSPNAAAYANRAMAYLKLSKFQEAEDDCNEALNLDDVNCKVYLRRALARKELDNLEGAWEDISYALSLEPDDEQVKTRHAEIKSLHEKASFAVREHGEERASSEVEMEGKKSAN